MPSSPFLSKYRTGAVVLPRPLLIGACLTWVLIILGCMSFSIGTPPGILFDEYEPFCQRGATRIGTDAVQQVYYPIPFASPPNLEIDDPFGRYVVVEQHADYFSVKNSNHSLNPHPVSWKARGRRATPISTVPHVEVKPVAVSGALLPAGPAPDSTLPPPSPIAIPSP